MRGTERRCPHIARSSQQVEVRDLSVPRRRILWKRIKTWKVTYRASPTKSHPEGHEIVIYTITRPPKSRTLRVAGGRRKFTAVRVSRPIREFIIYAPESTKLPRRKKKKHMGKKDKNKGEVTDNELEELENLEDVVDADEPDEDTDEAPTEKKSKKDKKKGKKSKDTDAGDDKPKKSKGGAAPGKSRAAANGKVGSAEIAAKGNTDARTLRMVLRKHNIEKNPETGRYEWDSFEDKTVKKILKLLKDGEAEAVKKEGLDRLKASKDAKEKTEDTNGGGKKKDKKKKDKKKNKS